MEVINSKLMDITSKEINEISIALSKFQGELDKVTYDKDVSMNGFSKRTQKAYNIKYKYLSMPKLLEVIKEPLCSNNIAYFQTTIIENNKLVLVTTISHSSGQWIRGFVEIQNNINDPQSTGSSMSYAKRYALSAILGICADDDDDGQIANLTRKQKEEEALEKQATIEKKLKEKRDLEIQTKVSNIEMLLDNTSNLQELKETFTAIEGDFKFLNVHSKKDYNAMMIKKDQLKKEFTEGN